MATTRTRTVAVVLGILAVAVIAGSLGHPVVIERWHLWRLDSEDEAVRRAAAEALGKRRSVRAVPRLLELLIDSKFSEDEERESRLLEERLRATLTALRDTETARLSLSVDPVGRAPIRQAREFQQLRNTIQLLRTRARSALPNGFALDALIEIGQPALDYAETLVIAPDDERAQFVVNELRDAVARQDNDEP